MITKKHVLVRPRCRIFNNIDKKTASNIDAEYLDTNARQELYETVSLSVSTLEVVREKNVSEYFDSSGNEVQLDLTGIGTEIVNDENLTSEVCYSENCGRPSE